MIYFISILDGLNSTLIAVATFATIACVVLLVCMFIERMEDLKVPCKWVAAVAVVSAILSALVPSTESLLKAYLLVEGSKIITADNAQEASKEILKRVDNMLKLLKEENK